MRRLASLALGLFALAPTRALGAHGGPPRRDVGIRRAAVSAAVAASAASAAVDAVSAVAAETVTFAATSAATASTAAVAYAASSAGSAAASASASAASTSISLPPPPSTAPASAPSPVPTPLDTSLSYALSDSCLLFLADLVANATFLSCLPFSLLLTTSTSYSALVDDATSTGNYTALDELLAYAGEPAPGVAACDAYAAAQLAALSQAANCKADLAGGGGAIAGQVARAAQTGLGNYAAVRQASQLVDPSTGVYCYLEALASDRPDDLYLWLLASGTALPKTSTPTCSTCSSLLLNLLAEAAANTTTLNTTIINGAAATVDAACGASFVTYSEGSSASGAARAATVGTAGLVAALFGAAAWLVV